MSTLNRFGLTDSLLFFSIVLLSAFGLILLYSATNQNIDIVYRQGTRLIFCFFLMILISFSDANRIKIISPYMYVLCIILLIVTLFWGHDSKGAKRWIVLFKCSFNFRLFRGHTSHKCVHRNYWTIQVLFC